jgi:hypothetical protein
MPSAAAGHSTLDRGATSGDAKAGQLCGAIPTAKGPTSSTFAPTQVRELCWHVTDELRAERERHSATIPDAHLDIPVDLVTNGVLRGVAQGSRGAGRGSERRSRPSKWWRSDVELLRAGRARGAIPLVAPVHRAERI